EIPLRMWYSV
ncbi:unnamed protein product, partial [Oikopleura dioica]